MADELSETRNMASPFFIGAPWVPKFCGLNTNYEDWESQISAMLRAQKWSIEQQCDFVLSALGGESRREILILEQAERDTPDKIFLQLKELYGDKTAVGTLRAMFYECRQRTEEPIRKFTLRLRELGHRLQTKEPQGFRRADLHLRDQFVLGLREGEIQRDLRRLLRHDPDLSFEQVRKEALQLEADALYGVHEDSACAVVRGDLKWQDTLNWRDKFKVEILAEMKEQIMDLKNTLQEELREFVRPAPMPRTFSAPRGERERWNLSSPQYRGGVEVSEPPPVTKQTPRLVERPRHKWDEHGQPICSRCGVSGHMARECRGTSSQMALNE